MFLVLVMIFPGQSFCLNDHSTGHFLQNFTELPPALAGGLKGATKIWALAQVFLHHCWAKAQILDCFSDP